MEVEEVTHELGADWPEEGSRSELLLACMRRIARAGGRLASPDEGVVDAARLELVRATLRETLDGADELRDGRVSRAEFARACAELSGARFRSDALFAALSHLADLAGRVPIGRVIDELAPSQRHAGEGRARLVTARDGGDGKHARGRTGVFAPTAWDESSALARRTLGPPDARLELEAIHGYAGLANSAPNLFCSSAGELVYYTAAVGVVLSVESRAQRFFLGHTDDIHCLALDPTRTIAATGQTADRALGGRPFVCVWDVASMHEYARLVHGRVNRVSALAFAAHGAWLATVGCSAPQSVHVWDWRARALLCEVGTGIQPAPRDVDGRTALSNVYGLRWSPHAPHVFLTHGKAHLHYWTAERERAGERSWRKGAAIFDPAPVVDVLCAEFVPNGDVVSGSAAGELYVWRSWRVVRVLSAHAAEVRVLLHRAGTCELVSAGARGIIHRWDVSGELPVLLAHATRQLPAAYEGERPPTIRALDAFVGSDAFVVGTGRCDIWQLDADPDILVSGHTADLVALDVHPSRRALFITAGHAERAFVWDASERRLVGITQRLVGQAIRCVSWAPPKGELIGVGAVRAGDTAERARRAGASDGCVALIDATGADGVFALCAMVDVASEPSALRFSPDGSRLAVGLRSGGIEVFALRRELDEHVLAPLCACGGHSCAVRQLDWSADSSLLQSSCAALELLRWHGTTGEQIRQDERDREWQTWSCIVGWPVMGVWPRGYDASDINALDRSTLGVGVAGGHVAVADDFGRVLLFNHPCVAQDAPHLAYRGHSSHVSGVRFLRGSERCISIGGHDRAVFQWAVWPSRAHDARAPGPPTLARGAPPLLAGARSADSAAAGPEPPLATTERVACVQAGGAARGAGRAAARLGSARRQPVVDARAVAAPGRARAQLVIAPRAPVLSVESDFERAVLARTPRYDAARYVGKLCAKLTRHEPAERADALREDCVRALLAHFGVPCEEDEFARLCARYPFASPTAPDHAACAASGGIACVQLGVYPAVSASSLIRALFASDARRRPRALAQSAPVIARPSTSAPLPVRHARCRTLLHPPSTGGVAAEQRSREPPDARLELEAIHGYAGLANSAPNLFCSSAGELVYYTAAVGVVLSVESRAQRFFLGHTDDIHCLALDPTRTIAATGQTADRALGGRPFVCVWDVASMHEYARLVHGRVNRVSALAFAAHGAWLATVGCSAPQSVHVWDWRARALLCEVGTGIQPAPRDVDGRTALSNVYGLRWSPHAPHVFLTHGKAHLHYWTAERERAGERSWRKGAAIFDPAPVVDVLCAEFVPNGDVVSGSAAGELYVWRSWRVVRVLSAHAAEVRVLLHRAGTCELVSAGARGIIHRWDVSGELPVLLAHATRQLPAAYEGERPPTIRALDAFVGSDAFVVGTGRCDIWQLDADPDILVSGHTADLVALDVHPSRRALFITAGHAERAFVWDASERRLVGITQRLVGQAIRCVSWAPPKGELIGVGAVRAGDTAERARRAGASDGCVALIDATGADGVFALCAMVDVASEPSALRFSPDGSRLAVGLRSGGIEVFALRRELDEHVLAPLCACGGHSCAVRQLDWSADSSLLQSSCAALELLRWHGTTGEQIRQDERDREWQTWSCIVGWPVMGVWPRGYDASDINALDRSTLGVGVAGGHVAVADDFGRVLLFNHPCVAQDAPHLAYRGHSSHVSGVRFLRGSERCISIGGHDRAVFQWAVWPSRAHDCGNIIGLKIGGLFQRSV